MDVAIIIQDLWGDGEDIRVHSVHPSREKAESFRNKIENPEHMTEYYIKVFAVHE